MEISFPIFPGISIHFTNDPREGNGYPTARLQRGFLLIDGDQDLSEEGVGFGVPVLMRGIHAIFPGHAELISQRSDSILEVNLEFHMNLEEKIIRSGYKSVKINLLYNCKDFITALIRRIPSLQGLLITLSNALRWMFDLQTTFEESGFCEKVKIVYTVDNQEGIIKICVDTTDLSGKGITDVIMMNEQGARHFDLYRDSSGTVLHGKEIECWEKIIAQGASFASEIHQLAFTLQQVNGATLFRGRELVGSRLAWSGFGYSFPPTTKRFCYEVRVERLQ